MADDFAIEANGLVKSYGSVQVLAGVDIRVARGGIFSLLGPNGAGKTTMVRILSTLVRPDGGTARVAGHDLLKDQRKVRRAISLTGQSVALDQRQTGEENLRMMAQLSGLSGSRARARAKELLTQFDLVEAGSRRVGTYSGGMRRRLDLAAGLVGEPSIVFLDEPTTGLDPRSRRMMWEVISGLTAAGVTIFLTTQYLEEADELAGHVALLDGGRVVAEGTPTELKERVAEQRLDVTFVDDDAFRAALGFLGERAVHREESRRTIGIATDGTAAHMRALLDEIDADRTAVTQFEVHSATLDDVFLALTGRAATRAEDQTGKADGDAEAEHEKENSGV
ncbi:ATP-binding cassette domain-containing protein [Actinosynnema sp. NPDC002837]